MPKPTSQAAKAVAREVIREVGNGRRPHKTKIQIKHGYSRESARSGKALKTKSYKEEIQPIVDRLEIERDRAVRLMSKKIGKAKYRDLVDSVDKLTKNLRLLTGESTANVAIGIKRLNDKELEKLAEQNEDHA